MSEHVASKPRTLLWIAAVVVTGLAVWGLTRPDAPRVARLAVSTPPSSAPRVSPSERDIAISPDGEWLVFTGGGGTLNLRHIDRFETTRLELGDPSSPFVSPDGAWFGFASAGALQKVPVLGGPPTTICEIEGSFRGATWAADDTIVFATAQAGLFRVRAGGGEPRQLTKPEGVRHMWPEMLPGNGSVVFSTEGAELGEFDIAVLSLDTGEHRVLIPGGTSPRYVPTGHLVYVVDGALMVVPFDAKRLETTGDAVPVLSGVLPKFTGAANFDVSDNGVLVYLPGDPAGGNRSLVWVDRLGREESLGFEPRAYNSVALSPDGDRAVSSIADEDVWIHDLARGTSTRLTFDPAKDFFPVWTPDGERVLFQSDRDGGGLFWRSTDGTGSAERVIGDNLLPFSVSPDGSRLVGVMERTETLFDVFEVSLDGQPTLRPLIASPRGEWYPQISPSGKWIAYQSDETGRYEIYVRPYPDVDAGLWQISTSGGRYPMWSPNEEELFYRNEDQMMAVPVVTDSGFERGTPSVLFQTGYFRSGEINYDVAADGQRVLMIKKQVSEEVPDRTEIRVVLNWFEELR